MPVKAFEKFNFKENKWTKLTDIPSSRVFSVYVHHADNIFSLGGLATEPKQGFSDSVEIYNIDEGNPWRLYKYDVLLSLIIYMTLVRLYLCILWIKCFDWYLLKE